MRTEGSMFNGEKQFGVQGSEFRGQAIVIARSIETDEGDAAIPAVFKNV